MHLHRSHDVALLADAFAELVVREPSPWNRTEWVAVQGRGMERWLSMRLSERFGGVLGVEYLFPRALVGLVLERTVGLAEAALSRWSDAELTWDVLALLPTLLREPVMEPLQRYLADEPADAPVSARRFGLARELASLVDRYATYRPAMVRDWLEGGASEATELWQPRLVQALGARLVVPSHAQVVDRAVRALRTEGFVVDLPRRISLFGVTTLPPVDLELLDALAGHTEVHLFWLSPTPHYFGDAQTPRERARSMARAPTRGEVAEEAATVEHPLLASLGRAARDFQSAVYGVCANLIEDDDRFEPAPEPTTVLGRLKRDLYDAEASGQHEARPKVAFPEGDRSLVVHACHGRTRQVEALRDELLRAFVELPGLEPRDVVVLCPDVDAYAPILRAVFGEGDPPDGSGAEGTNLGFPRIPLRVADTSPRHDAAAVDALLAILSVASGRLSAPEVADLLVRPLVAARFGLTSASPEALHRIVRETGMRWGIDGRHRATFDQPDDDAFTLRRGLDRLLLGQAMRGEGHRAHRDVLPFDDVDDRELVAGIVEAMTTLFEIAESLRSPRTIRGVRALVKEVLDRMILLPAEESWQRDQLIDALLAALPEEQRRAAASADRAQPPGEDESEVEILLAPDAVRALLETAFTAVSGPTKLLGGAVSVASLVPMRAIPFRVVCLLGLDEAGFPRRSIGRGFDLTERRRLPGDRRAEDDDRAAMLEAISSAGDRLVITYQGRDPHRNRELPMAAPVAEMLECLASTYLPDASLASGDPAAARECILAKLVVHHALHPFGERELDGSLPRGFDERQVAYANVLRGRTADAHRTFVDGVLPPRGRDEEGRVLVRLEELLAFASDPIRSFLDKRARVTLDSSVDELEDREPYELTSLGRARLRAEMLQATRDGLSDEVQFDRLRLSGRLPVGRAGRTLFDAVRREVESLLRAAAPVMQGPRLPSLAVDTTLHAIPALGEQVSVRLVGTIDDRFAAGRLRIHPQRARIAHLVRAYVEQAVARATCGVEESTLVVARGANESAECHTLGQVAEAEGYLRDVLSLHLVGSRVPLPFHLEAASTYLSARAAAVDDGLPEAVAARSGRIRARASLDKGGFGGRVAESERLDLRRLFGSPPASELFEPSFETHGAPHFEEIVERLVAPALASVTLDERRGDA